MMPVTDADQLLEIGDIESRCRESAALRNRTASLISERQSNPSWLVFRG